MKISENTESELKRIYERDGGLKTTVVVEEAKSKASPLHSEFEWNNSKAGHEYRLIQARQLIRLVRVTKVGDDGKSTRVPMFIHVQSEKGPREEGVYVTEEVLVKHPDLYMRALEEARSLLTNAAASFRQLESIARQGGKTENAIAIIGIAEKGLQAAIEAVRRLEAA